MGASPPTARGVARPEAGQAGGPSAPLAMGAGGPRAVGGGPADPLYEAGPPGVRRPNALRTEFIRNVVEESIRVWYAHAKARATLLKARLGQGSTMAWALQELRLHQHAEREGVQRELLG